MAVAGLVVLAANVLDAVDRGSSVWNLVAVAAGAFLLFYGFVLVGRTPTSARDDDPTPGA